MSEESLDQPTDGRKFVGRNDVPSKRGKGNGKTGRKAAAAADPDQPEAQTSEVTSPQAGNNQTAFRDGGNLIIYL